MSVRTAIYARVSSEAQAGRGTIASQVEVLEEKVAAEGDELVARFIDDGHSGARLDRPGLDALRDQAEAGLFERVWCLTPDRLARNFAYQMLVVDEFARLGVELRFVDAPPVEDNPQARLLVQVQGVIAEYERAHSAERQRRGKLYKVRAGEAIFWKVPYGYRRVPRSEACPAHLEVYEPEAAVVRRIFDDYVAGGYSIREISRRLYADGVPSPRGRPVWATSTLGPLLRDSTYAGTAYWYRYENAPAPSPSGKPKRRRRPREDWVAVPTPAIISPEKFEAASRISEHNKAFSPRNAPSDRWLLRSLVVCGPCGVRCGCARIPSSRGGHNYYYYCVYRDPIKAGGPEKRCHERQIRADELDAFVFEQVRSALLDPKMLTAGEAAVTSRQPLPDDDLLAAELERLQRQLSATEAERRRLVDCYQAGLIELAELTRRAEDVKARAGRLDEQREQLIASRAELATENRLRARVEDFASRVASGIDRLDFAGRQRLVRLVVEQVRVTGWHVEIRLRIPLDEAPVLATPPSPRPRSPRSRSRCQPIADADEVSSNDRLRSVGAEKSFNFATAFGAPRAAVDQAHSQDGKGTEQLPADKWAAVVQIAGGRKPF
jgi:site-specific DNA recombinase